MDRKTLPDQNILGQCIFQKDFQGSIIKCTVGKAQSSINGSLTGAIDVFYGLSIEPTCVNYTIERWFPVANMSRYLPIRVYDYYAPGMYIIYFFIAVRQSDCTVPHSAILKR